MIALASRRPTSEAASLKRDDKIQHPGEVLGSDGRMASQHQCGGKKHQPLAKVRGAPTTKANGNLEEKKILGLTHTAS